MLNALWTLLFCHVLFYFLFMAEVAIHILKAFLDKSCMFFVKGFWPFIFHSWWIRSHVQEILLCLQALIQVPTIQMLDSPSFRYTSKLHYSFFHKRRSTLFWSWLSVSTYRSIFIWQHRIALFQLLTREYNFKFPHAQYLSIKGPSERSLFVEHFFKAILFISSST